MSIITISRGSFTRGKIVAEEVAAELGYECLSRDIILEAHAEFNVPAVKLIRAIEDAPSILDRFSSGKQKYVNYIRATLLKRALKDNMVYHGLAGQFFLRGVSHALNARIIAHMQDRVKEEMERENIGRREAFEILKKDDEERRKWSLALYGIDAMDPSLYDLVIHIGKVTVDDAVEIICNTVRKPQFDKTPESTRTLEDLIISAEVENKLMHMSAQLDVFTHDGVVHIETKTLIGNEGKTAKEMISKAKEVDGVKDVKVHIHPLDMDYFE